MEDRDSTELVYRGALIRRTGSDHYLTDIGADELDWRPLGPRVVVLPEDAADDVLAHRVVAPGGMPATEVVPCVVRIVA